LSEFETATGGRWNLGDVVDDWANINLAAPVTITKTTSDAIDLLEAALADVKALLGIARVADLTDPATGEVATVRLVTDNGSCSPRRASPLGSPHSATSPTSASAGAAPWANGVVERFLQAIKYEYLYRQEITSGVELADQVATFRAIYDTIRPHEAMPPLRIETPPLTPTLR